MILATMVVLGALVGAGLFLLLREAAPVDQPRLDQALDRLAPEAFRNSSDPRGLPDTTPARGTEHLGQLIERHFGDRPGFIVPEADLDILGRTRRSWWTEKATLALLGLLMPLLLVAADKILGIGLPLVLPAGAGLALAVIFWFLPDATIRAKATRARAEFVQAVVAYLQLSAIQRTAAGAQETLYATAELGRSWPFERIRQELTRARWARVQPWDALTQLGEQTHIPEVSEVGDIMRLAGDSNAAVADTLAERAIGLQSRIMSEEWAKANAATSSMAVPIGGMATVIVLAVMIPVLATLLAS